MLKRTVFLLLLLFPLLITAQLQTPTSWDKVGIQKMLDEYLVIMENNDMKATLDYIHPQIFEIVPRKVLEQQIAQTFADTSVKISMGDFEIEKISKIITKERVNFARVDYHFVMEMQMAGEMESSGDDEDDFMLEMYQGMYGKKNVTFNEETNTYVISRSTSLFAIGDPKIGSWKMLENKPNAADFVQTIMPPKVYKKLR